MAATVESAFRRARRYHGEGIARAMPRPATAALALARQRVADHEAAAARYHEAQEAREAAEKAGAAAEELNRLRDAETKARRAASRARVACYAPGKDYGPGTWQGGPGETEAERRDNAGRRFPVFAQSMNKRDRGGLFALHDDTGQGAVRNARDSHDVARLNHTGWLADPFGDVFRDGTGLCFGMVAQLRARDGRAVFVPGYRFGGMEDSGVFDMRAQFVADGRDESAAEEAAEEAARLGDSMAESAAEREREWQSAWQAGNRWRDCMEREEQARKEARAILKERREAMARPGLSDSGFFALCDAIRARVSGLLDDIRESREERARLAEGDSDPLYFWRGDETAKAAFCEGAEIEHFPA